MKFERISYSESIEAVNASGNKKWFKSSADIIEIDDNVTRATELAIQYVSETIKKSISENPNYIPDPATFYSKSNFTKSKDLSVDVDNKFNTIDKEWEEVKANLEACLTRGVALEYLDTTPYKHTVEAKKIANSKN